MNHQLDCSGKRNAIPRQKCHSSGARLDKIITELSSKLALLSGEECEIEVNIRVKFPRSSSSSGGNEKSRRRSCSGSSKHSKKKPSKEMVPQPIPNQLPPSNTMRDFVFDIESYAKSDPRDIPTPNQMPASKIVKRPPSPDTVTFEGMGNPDKNFKVRSDYNAAFAPLPHPPQQASSPSSPSTTELFPKGYIRYRNQK